MPLSRSLVWASAASTEVVHEAEQFAEGVLVMGASSQGRAARLGLTAEAVLRGCPSSVWIVRKRSWNRKKREMRRSAAPINPSAPVPA
jgi:hypothetical protein